MSPRGPPGSRPNCNLLRCRNRTPQGTGTSSEEGWGAAREAVPAGTGAESWGPGWCTRSWEARCPPAWALRPNRRGRKTFLSLHPQSQGPHCPQALRGSRCMGSGAATTHPVPGRCPGHALCPPAPVRAPGHPPLGPQPESLPSGALRGPLGGQVDPRGSSYWGSTTGSPRAAAARAGKRGPAGSEPWLQRVAVAAAPGAEKTKRHLPGSYPCG